MARFRKAAALIACAVMASTVSGCADTSYSVKYGDETVKAGVYIGYVQTELNNQLYMFSYQGIESKDYFSQEIDGVGLSDYVKNNALKDVKEYVAIKKQFEADGLSFSDDELKDISSNVNTSWENMGGLYEYNGVSKESLKEIYRESLMRSMLFNHYYGEGGSEAPSDEDLQKYVNDNYIRYKMIAIYKSSNSDESAAATENEEKLKKRDEYFDKGKDMTFEEFDQLIADYQAESAAAADTDSSEPDDTSLTDDSSEASDDTSSVADTSSESESTADDSSAAESVSSVDTPDSPAADADASSEAESKADADSSSESQAETDSSSESQTETDSSSESQADADSSETESQADTDSTAETTDGETEKETDPYANDVMIDLKDYTDEDFDTSYGKLYKAVKDAEVGKVFKFENDSAYYIVIRGDVSQRTDYVGANRTTLVQSLKSDDFQAKLDGWVEAANITVNDKAIKRYTPELIYDRMVEYSEKNSK